MILHGIESPNITQSNTLAENILDIQQAYQCDDNNSLHEFHKVSKPGIANIVTVP